MIPDISFIESINQYTFLYNHFCYNKRINISVFVIGFTTFALYYFLQQKMYKLIYVYNCVKSDVQLVSRSRKFYKTQNNDTFPSAVHITHDILHIKTYTHELIKNPFYITYNETISSKLEKMLCRYKRKYTQNCSCQAFECYLFLHLSFYNVAYAVKIRSFANKTLLVKSIIRCNKITKHLASSKVLYGPIV